MANPFQQQYEQYGSTFGVSPGLLTNIGKLESGHQAGVVNTWDSNAKKGTPSVGVMQFIQPTFESFFQQAKQARPDVFGKWKMNWKDPEQQIATAAWAIANGKGSHWATYDRAAGMSPDASVSPSQPSGGFSYGDSKALGMARLHGLRGGANDSFFKKLNAVPTGSMTGLSQEGGGGGGYAATQFSGEIHPSIQPFLQQFGIKFDSNLPWGQNPQQGGGQHVKGSGHGRGIAFDVGDAANNMQTLTNVTNYARNNPGKFSEFFWQPAGFWIKNGQLHQGKAPVKGHVNHAHVAFL